MVAEVIPKIGAITLPVAIETYFPQPVLRKADLVTWVAAIGHVGQDHHIVAGTTLIPTVEAYNLILLIDVEDVDIWSTQTPGVIMPVATQAY